MSDENLPPRLGDKRRGEDPTLTQPPRKKAYVVHVTCYLFIAIVQALCPSGPSDSWKLKGRHIRRSIHMFANFTHLMLAGIQIEQDLAVSSDQDIEQFPSECVSRLPM